MCFTQALREEIAEQTEKLKTLTDEQSSRYGTSTAHLPPDVTEQLQALDALQVRVSAQLQRGDDALGQVRRDKQVFDDGVREVADWLATAEATISADAGERDAQQSQQQVQVRDGLQLSTQIVSLELFAKITDAQLCVRCILLLDIRQYVYD